MPDALARIFDLPAAKLLIGSVVVVSVWGWLFKPVQRALVLSPYRVRYQGEVYRLATAGWVHVGVVHLALNMLTLYLFAGQVVGVIKVERFLFLYVSAVVVGFIPTTLRHLREPGYTSLGASGAVIAVVFSAILLHPRLKLYVFFMPVSGAVFAVAYLAYSVWHSMGSGDRVNHEAHVAGALYGALLTYLFEPTRVERTLRTLWW